MGYKVKDAREAEHLTQAELSQRSGVSRATISAIENSNGECNVTMDTLRKLARALNRTVEDIFFDDSV